MSHRSWLGILLLATGIPAIGQQGDWKGRSCAVVLTYDDGLNVHQRIALPALDSLGLKATFYIADYKGELQKQIPGWRRAAARGHELGNHTLYHPCTGNRPGREFVTPDRDLSRYSLGRIRDEIRTMNTMLYSIDGKTKRSFAYPCADKTIGDSAYLAGMEQEFVAVRSVYGQMPLRREVKLNDLPCYMVNGQSGEELIALVKQAREKKALLIFLFHGVGGEHDLNVSQEAHSQLLHYLKEHQQEIWIPTVAELAEELGHQRSPSGVSTSTKS